MNKGIPVPFFGQPAPTNPVLAQFALRHGCVVLPVRIERTGGARFRAVCEPPLEIRRSGDREADILALMTAANAVIERWARTRPEQWLWLHRRWKD
jgi:KDO2-lipid IV(A) lauroyltransferase